MSGSVDRLKCLLIRHEGMKLRAYYCPAGRITVGVGRNLEDLGLTEDEALYLLDNDIRRFRREVSQGIPWFSQLDDVRQEVLICMAFNLGLKRLMSFRGMLAALKAKDYDRAASEMLNSVWAAQVKKRAVELAQMMRTGEYAEL